METLRAELAAMKRDSAIQPREALHRLLANPPRRIAIAAAVVAIPLAAYATPITLPYTFVNGTVADATEVNANFNALVTESNAQDSRISSLESRGKVKQGGFPRLPERPIMKQLVNPVGK